MPINIEVHDEPDGRFVVATYADGEVNRTFVSGPFRTPWARRRTATSEADHSTSPVAGRRAFPFGSKICSAPRICRERKMIWTKYMKKKFSCAKIVGLQRTCCAGIFGYRLQCIEAP